MEQKFRFSLILSIITSSETIECPVEQADHSTEEHFSECATGEEPVPPSKPSDTRFKCQCRSSRLGSHPRRRAVTSRPSRSLPSLVPRAVRLNRGIMPPLGWSRWAKRHGNSAPPTSPISGHFHHGATIRNTEQHNLHKELRPRSYADVSDRHFPIGSQLEERERPLHARRPASASCCNSDGECSKTESEECLHFAIELRRRVGTASTHGNRRVRTVQPLVHELRTFAKSPW
jgi:hypothetical protein